MLLLHPFLSLQTDAMMLIVTAQQGLWVAFTVVVLICVRLADSRITAINLADIVKTLHLSARRSADDLRKSAAILCAIRLPLKLRQMS